MAVPLSRSHFRPQPHTPISDLPETARLAARLADAGTQAFSGLSAAAFRMTVDKIGEGQSLTAGFEAHRLRFESEAGSMNVDVILDRPAICAIVEAVMGGTGTEAPYDMGDRPLSRIEAGIMSIASKMFASEAAAALESCLGRPFSHFVEEGDAQASATAGEHVMFRFVLTVFGQSGELRLIMPVSELTRQRESSADADQAIKHEANGDLQIQIGRSELELTIGLQPQIMSIEMINGLAPGVFLPLNVKPSSPVNVWCNGTAIFEGRLARDGDRLAVSITSPLT